MRGEGPETPGPLRGTVKGRTDAIHSCVRIVLGAAKGGRAEKGKGGKRDIDV